jgi:hypothetical protein
MAMHSDEILNKVTSYGVLGYAVDQIISLLAVQDEAAFRADFFDGSSKLHQAYMRGVNTGKYTLDKRMFDAAQDGDQSANQTLYERMLRSKIDNAISEKFHLS